MSLGIEDPGDIMHTLNPYTQHLTKLTFRGELPNNIELLFSGISIHNPMLEDLVVHCDLTPEELLPLVSNLPKLKNLANFNTLFQ